MDELTKIDDAVAEHVMRWQRRVYYWDRPKGEGNHYMLWCKNWQPTRNIAQAWQVVEKIEAKKWGVFVSTKAKGWFCSIREPGRSHQGDADTAAMAICLCALKAVGHAE